MYVLGIKLTNFLLLFKVIFFYREIIKISYFGFLNSGNYTIIITYTNLEYLTCTEYFI